MDRGINNPHHSMTITPAILMTNSKSLMTNSKGLMTNSTAEKTNTQQTQHNCASTVDNRSLEKMGEVIKWLQNNGYPALPVAPKQDPHEFPKLSKNGEIDYEKDGVTPKPRFSGKNPSYLDTTNVPHLVPHQEYNKKLPCQDELEKWFQNPQNGIGTKGGWENTIWIDLDVGKFESQEDCNKAFSDILERAPKLKGTWLEQTHSGGYRIAIKLKQKPNFTNFALEPGGDHVGEALGEGRFTVLAPTMGASGNCYETINNASPVEVESLESLGIYSTRKQKQNSKDKTRAKEQATSDYSPNSIPLEMLGTDLTRDVLSGNSEDNDRSNALTTAIQEWWGWFNWCFENSVPIYNSVEYLAFSAGESLGIDNDRIERILKTINNNCEPSAKYKSGDEACWKRIKKLNRTVFNQQCPTSIKESIHKEQSEWRSNKDNSQNQSRGAQSHSQEDSFEKIPEWNQGDIAEWLAERYRGENNQQNQNGLAWFMDIKRWHCYGSEVQGIWSEIEPEACRNTITAELKNLRQKFAEYIAKLDSRVEELQEEYSNCEGQEERETINNEMKRLSKKIEALKKKLQSMVYSNNFVRGIEELLKSELGCKSWETPKDKIPFLNGVLDLNTMELKGHAPGNYLTWCLPYNYNPQAHCEPIKEWLLEMLRGDKNLMHLLRAYLNAVILGKTELQSFIELLGTGGTGKSTFIRLAMALVGTENVHTTTLSALEHSRFETASIWGKRLVIISDSERYTGSVTTLKALTGQDQIRYERKFGQPSGGFQPEAMVIIASNESIQSSEYTSAMQRRRITVPMNKKIKKSQYRNLLEVSKDGNEGEFADYIPGLFNWVLELSDQEVKETILNEAHNSSELERAKAENLVQTNPIADWLDRYLVYRRDAKTKVGTAKRDKDSNTQTQYQNTHAWLYASYCEYCAGTQSRPIGLNRFVSLLDDLCNNQLGLKVSKSKTKTGNYFFGLRFRSEADDDDFLISASETPEEQISLNLDTSPTNSTSRSYEPAPEGEASDEAVKTGEGFGEDSVKGLVKTSTPALKDGEDGEDPTRIIKRTGERKVEVESSFDVERDNNPIKGKIWDESSHPSPQSPETAHTENQSNTQNPSPTLHQPFTNPSPSGTNSRRSWRQPS